jgi:pyruvate/2-oxoglutarate dehydrogenase complex dihydrolipoamide acyltransferase (E2) component
MVSLVEFDVTRAREQMLTMKETTGEGVSFTAFILGCLAKAVAEHPDVQAYRDLRDRLVVFDDVDVAVSFEVLMEGRPWPMSHVVRAANRRSAADIHSEIRAIKRDPASSPSTRWIGPGERFVMLPAAMRAALLRSLRRFPWHQRQLAGTVGLSSVGMYGAGGGWAIPFQVHTLNVLVGGIVERPVIVDGVPVRHEFVDVTLSFDHDVVDGAPAARFTATLRALIESAHGLTTTEVGATRVAPTARSQRSSSPRT